MHNLTVQGSGTAVLVTDLRIAVSNSGTSAANLRFDSLITPGYISVQDAGVGTEALSLFNFEVRQYRGDPDAPGVAGVDFNIHYFALGELGSGRNQVFVQNEYLNGPFTGLTQYNSLGRTAYEWGATPLSLPLLPIQPGETHTIQYRTATIALVRGGVCETALGCEGVQVAFGDPRNDGSVGSLRASFSQPSNNQPLIGRLFDAPTYSLANIVEQSAPLPLSLPPPALPPNYDWLPPVDVARAAVPEPSTWLMVITGFGLAGLAMRRQRRQLLGSA